MSEQITVTVVDKRPAVIEGNLEIIPFPDLVAGKVLGNDGTKLLWQDAGAGGGVWGTITGTLSDQTDLQQALNGKAALVHSHAIADVTGLQAALDGKAALSHTHAIADVTGLQAALDGKAALSHTHAIADVTGLQSALDGKAALSHTHGLDALILGGTAGQAVVSGGAGAATLFAPAVGQVIFAGTNGVLTSDAAVTYTTNNLTITGNGKGLAFSGGNNRIYFNGNMRAMEGDAGWLFLGESYGKSIFYSKLGIKGINPTAYLHIAGGTESPNTAPLKFTAGTNLTTPENGAMEFDGTNLYFTIGGVRKTVVLS
jgi:hypothetical protein